MPLKIPFPFSKDGQEPQKDESVDSLVDKEVSRPGSTKEEIMRLERELAEKRAELARRIEKAREEEISREIREKPEVIPSREKALPISEEKEIARVVVPPAPPGVVLPTQDEISAIRDAQQQVQILVNLAFQKGINQAVAVAKKINNAYILDEFHDELIDKFEELVRQGKLKKI